MKELNINNFEEKGYYEKLKNGLEVYLVPMNNKKGYFVSLCTRFGGANISFKLNNDIYNVPTGIAHFLEHKLFERKKSPFKFYSESGTDVNASTNVDHTSYYFMGNNNIIENTKYLVKWISTFSLTNEQVEKEKGIILEEASMYKDIPDRLIYEKISKNTFINHPYKYKVIGTDDDIKKITKDQLELCYNAFYHPNNMFLVVVGNFNQNEMIKQIKEAAIDWKSKELNVVPLEPDEPDQVNKPYEELEMNLQMSRLAVAYKINKKLFKNLNINEYEIDYYLQMILTLVFGSTSEFAEKMQNDDKYSTFGFELSDIKDHYIINLFATTNKPHQLKEEIKQELSNIKFTEKDFKRIIKVWIASEIRLIDSIAGTAKNILYDVLDYKEFKNEKIKDCENLKYEELVSVKERLNFDNQAVVIINKKMNS